MDNPPHQHIVDIYTISSSHGWDASPWNDASLVWLQLKPNSEGKLTYGYGQTIYAVIKCRWELAPFGILRLLYLPSPPCQHFQGFVPDSTNHVKEIEYQLTEGEVTGIENRIVPRYKYFWTMELSDSPWPDGLELPRKIPTTFYGHRQKIESTPRTY